MRLGRLRFRPEVACIVALTALLPFGGCSSDDSRSKPPEITDAAVDAPPGTLPDDGGIPDARRTIDGNVGDGGGSISVTILTPMADVVLPAPQIDVTARVVVVNGIVDTTTVQVELNGTSLPPARLALMNGSTDTYQGSLQVGSLTTGAYDLIVHAGTLDGGRNEDSRRIKINAGPIIRIFTPSPSQPSDGKQLPFDFAVNISTLLSGLSVGNVTATIGNCTIALGTPSASGEYSGTKDLTGCSPLLAEGPQQLTVTAQDTSNPAVQASAQAIFVIDRRGPAISVLSPTAAQLVGGIIEVSASVSDPSGVNPVTVKATISHGGTGFTFPLTAISSTTYSSTFDLHRLPYSTQIQYPAVEVVADDLLGNHSSSGGLLFTIDNVPPTGEFDPPPAYLARVQNNVLQCSHPFDPVGSSPFDQMNDTQTVQQIFDLRAEVADDGNHGNGADYDFISLVSTVDLYVLDDTTQPLVVDSDNDGICDAINPHVVPATGMPPGPQEAVVLGMVQMLAAGSGDFTPASGLPAGCSPGNDAMPPASLCFTTNMTVAVADYQRSSSSLIWTLPPVVQNDLQCEGLQFDALANNIQDGWICVAAAFVDGVGNRSVTPPFRLCVDKNNTGVCASAGPPPNCTGKLDVSNGTVSNTACQGRRFPNPQIFYP